MSAAAQQPWLKFYTSDWRADPGLRMCSYAARGLWIDMLSLMHEAEPYGHLMVAGIAPDPDDLAGLLGGSPEEVAALLAQLERRRVFSKTDDGVIYSRRMVKDRLKAEQDRANGARGGNPGLKRKGEPANPTPTPSGGEPKEGADGLTGGDNPQGLTGGDKAQGLTGGDKAQKPESRVQKLDSAHESLSPRERESDDAVVPIMPRSGEPPEKWMRLADKREVDRDGVPRPMVGGYYLDVVAPIVEEAAGLDPVRWRGDWRPLIEWLRSGADLYEQILPVIRKRAERPGYKPPATLKWFTEEIMALVNEDRAA